MNQKDFETIAADWLNKTRTTSSPATTRRRLASLRSFGRWMGLHGVLAEYRPPASAPARPHPVPEGKAGVLRMIAYARNDAEAALVALQGLCGLRVSEARSVTVASFNTVERTLTVRGKGDKERTIPVPAEAWSFLVEAYERAGDRPLVDLSDRAARAAITRLARDCGLERQVSSHDLRATFATEILRKTSNLRLVQELLGHANSKSTEFYTQITLDDMRREVER